MVRDTRYHGNWLVDQQYVWNFLDQRFAKLPWGNKDRRIKNLYVPKNPFDFEDGEWKMDPLTLKMGISY